MKSRLFALLLSITGGILFLIALRIEAPFSYDPLGPRLVPVIVSFGLLGLPLFLVFNLKRAPEAFDANPRVLKLIGSLFIYLALFELLGFMLATTLSCYLIARIIGSSRMQGLLTGLLVSIVFYGTFRLWLEANLPLGMVFELIG